MDQWAVVVTVIVAQLVEARGSNPVIGNISIEHLYTVECIEKTKINKKKPSMDI